MKVAILGMGSYALALAYMFCENDCYVTLYSPFNKEINQAKIKHPLLNKKIPNKFLLSNDLSEVINNAKIIVYATPSNVIQDLTKEIKKYYKNSLILVASKGIDNNTYKFPCEQIKNILKTNKIAFMAGGGFAIDIVHKEPFGLTVASTYRNVKSILNKYLANNYLSLSYTKDIIGVQLCSCLKNIIAISMGILDGKNYSETSKSYFITNIINESLYFIKCITKNPNTILSYCGLGDIILSSYSKKSRNYYLGYLFGSNKSKKTIENYIKFNTIEGLNNLKTLYNYITIKHIKVNYIIDTYNIVFNNYNINSLLDKKN